MLGDLTERQLKLLEAIINEYADSSNPVGSQTIVKKYGLRCSAATVRNDMADLLEKGFLDMIHTSSGRIPSTTAYRLFLQELMEEDDLPVLQEVAVKQRLWPNRFEFGKLLRQAAISLSDITKELAVITTDDGFVTHAGAVNVLDYPEFWDIGVAKAALGLLDRYELLEEIFNKAEHGEDVRSLIGQEMGNPELQNCSIVFAPYNMRSKSGYVGVLGPSRMKYQSIYPAIRYTRELIEELGSTW